MKAIAYILSLLFFSSTLFAVPPPGNNQNNERGSWQPYNATANTPPGLQKKGMIPPGLQKNGPPSGWTKGQKNWSK